MAETLSKSLRHHTAAEGFDLPKRVDGTLDVAVDRLLARQYDDGHWCAELEGDSILQSEYILTKWILGEEDDPDLPAIANHLRRHQLSSGAWAQYPGGEIGGGRFDLSATVKGYFALKLMGDSPEAEHMRKARDLILNDKESGGGAEWVNSFSKFYLAALGQVSYQAVPTIPPQLVFLPKWFYFHLDKVSAWSRTMIVPLGIITATRPMRQLSESQGIGELFKDQRTRDRVLATGFGQSRGWTKAFLALDRGLKWFDKVGLLHVGKANALDRLENWLIQHCQHSDGPGAIFPPIVYLLIALQAGRGYDADHPLIRENKRHLRNYFIYGEHGKPRNSPPLAPGSAGGPFAAGESPAAGASSAAGGPSAAGRSSTTGGPSPAWGPSPANPDASVVRGDHEANTHTQPDPGAVPRQSRGLMEDDETTIHLQPCESPVWDTGIAAYALVNAGLDSEHDALRRCTDWLLSKECRQRADWQNNLPDDVPFSGWFFEYHNPWYPDLDDTVMISMALRRIADQANVNQCANAYGETERRLSHVVSASQRSFDWIRAMQNADGGWAAFDRGACGRPILDCVPFADHNALQDPSCPDITGRTLECLGAHGITANDPNVQRAIHFIRNTQEHDGCWFGRWGVNYIYGTWQVVCGLEKVGLDMNATWIQRAGQWLADHQKPDGSFGESPDSYEDPTLRGQGPSTASQTAWAAMAMMSVLGPDHEAVHRALNWLCETQITEDGANAAEGEGEPGDWHEPWFTGTGFPRVFYLRYHLYRLYFPIMALGRWRQLVAL